MSIETRCEWSDLPAETCACPEHRGDDRAIQPGDVRPAEPAPAVKIWPEAKRTPTTTPPTTRATEPVDDLRVQVARDLRAIRDMAAMLGERATDLATDQLMPGGEATVNLAHVADRGAWEANLSRTETEAMDAAASGLLARAYTSVADEDPDEAWSVLQRLDYWTSDWRRELGMDYGQRPTITSEAAFASHPDVLDWASGHELGWGEAVEDFRRARVQLENIVRDGIRTTRSRIMCDQHHPDKAHRKLTLVYSDDEEQGYIAPCCHARYTPNEAKRAHARQMRSAGSERFVPVPEAVAALAVQGWQQRTVRRWVEPLRRRDRCVVCERAWPEREHAACPNLVVDGDEVTACGGDLLPEWVGDFDAVPLSYCEVGTHRTLVWWPDVWRRHLLARHEAEARESA